MGISVVWDVKPTILILLDAISFKFLSLWCVGCCYLFARNFILACGCRFLALAFLQVYKQNYFFLASIFYDFRLMFVGISWHFNTNARLLENLMFVW